MYRLYEELEFRKYLLNKYFGNVQMAEKVFQTIQLEAYVFFETISRWKFLIPSNNQYDLRMDL